MIRRPLITGLAVTAISLAALGWVGYRIPVYREYSLTNRLYFYVHFANGLARLYWVRGHENIFLDPSNRFDRMVVRRSSDGSLCTLFDHALPGRVRPYALVWSIMRPPRGAPPATIRLFGVRTRIWLPIVAFITYPVVALVRDRLHQRRLAHRRRYGLCLECGYNLKGLPEARCPECGSAYDVSSDEPGQPDGVVEDAE